MIQLDIDTIKLFKGNVEEENCICFYGDKDLTFDILYKHNLSSNKTSDFYKIINPTNSELICHIYIFNFLTDAMVFYKSKWETFFNNSLIVIVDKQSKKEVAELLRNRLNGFKSVSLHFFHRKETPDLYLFYLDMLNINIQHNIMYLDTELCLNVKYKSVDVKLSFGELKQLLFFLSIDDKLFKIKNNILSLTETKKIIIW